ncbi:MAG: peptidoglycan endopeptidase [Treponema sp.]|nr:peptidoglycan endopeptidase [Treponema sp.]
MARKYWLLLVLALAAARAAGAEEKDHIAAFSDPARVWGPGAESVIEEAYREGFKTVIIGGRVMNLRMPFAENNERSELADRDWEILGGGKADPRYLWEAIEEIFKTEDFLNYTRTVRDGREKVIVFDIPTKTWSASFDLFDIARMKAGAYRGLPHRPYVLVSGSGIQESDVYNYLYCVGWIGMDCSGFVWHVLSYVARKAGVDLGRSLGRSIGGPRGSDPSRYVGTVFFDSRSRELITVKDEIRNLRPADVLLFRGEDGSIVHSAVIQSVNFSTGVIRYLQSTDEAPLAERGIHESFITFDPDRPELSLSDPAVSWNQARYPPFPGEKASAFSNDGERYRAYAEKGGGKVVRLRIMAGIINKLAG